MITKYQYCFADIPIIKARIFMKFHVVVNYYLVNLSMVNDYEIFWDLGIKMYTSNEQKDTCLSLWVAF